MSDTLSVIVAFFAAMGMVSLVWIVAAALSAPERGSELFLLSVSRCASDIEADLHRAAWFSRTGTARVTLLLLEDTLTEADLRVARQLCRHGALKLVSRDAFELCLGNEYERNT